MSYSRCSNWQFIACKFKFSLLQVSISHSRKLLGNIIMFCPLNVQSCILLVLIFRLVDLSHSRTLLLPLQDTAPAPPTPGHCSYSKTLLLPLQDTAPSTPGHCSCSSHSRTLLLLLQDTAPPFQDMAPSTPGHCSYFWMLLYQVYLFLWMALSAIV